MAGLEVESTERRAQGTALRILHVEDNEVDAELVAAILRRAGHDCRFVRVDTREGCHAALASERFDLILADYTLPGFDGSDVLDMAVRLQPATPFIFVSATLGEEIAIETVKSGATDFVLKHSLGRLVSSVHRALREREESERRHQAEEALLCSERRFRFLAQATEVLSRSLNYRATLPEVAQMAVPSLADWCAIYTIEEQKPSLIALAHRNPGEVAHVRDALSRCSEGEACFGMESVLQSRQPRVCTDINFERRDGAAADEQHDGCRELGMRSYLCVPLVAREHVLGLISLVHAESGRNFTSSDRELAIDLARRAAATVENAKLYEEAQEAIRARDEFLSIASHELKTPLTSLQLEVQMLLRLIRKGTVTLPQAALASGSSSGLRAAVAMGEFCGAREGAPCGTAVPEQLAGKMETLEKQIRKLSKLVNNLLDVARIAAGRFEIRREEVDLARVTCDVVSRFRQQVELAGSTIEVCAPQPVIGIWDRLRIEQVVTNIVSNALKYGRAKPVLVRVEKTDARARLTVKDCGIGIAPPDLDRIFDRFTRAAVSRNYAGLGLGLYIVKQIVDRLEGSVAVESELGTGSTFTVELPLNIDATSGTNRD